MTWLVAVSVATGLVLTLNFLRARWLPPKELTPNCLLTRYPIVFVEGRKSLFYFMSYWNTLPEFLRQHGYEIRLLATPWRGHKKRSEFLKSWASVCDKVHLVFDESLSAEAEALDAPNIISKTLVIDGAKVENIDKNNQIYLNMKPLKSPSLLHSFLLKLHNMLGYPDVKISPTSVFLSRKGLEENYSLVLKNAVDLAEKDLTSS